MDKERTGFRKEIIDMFSIVLREGIRKKKNNGR